MIEQDFGILKGVTLTKIDRSEDELLFHTQQGGAFKLYHEQDCCESVLLESITGELDDILNTPVLLAEEVNNVDEPSGATLDFPADSYTWTFYKLSTIKGSVTLRWYGESNGYYSEEVSFVQIDKEGK